MRNIRGLFLLLALVGMNASLFGDSVGKEAAGFIQNLERFYKYETEKTVPRLGTLNLKQPMQGKKYEDMTLEEQTFVVLGVFRVLVEQIKTSEIQAKRLTAHAIKQKALVKKFLSSKSVENLLNRLQREENASAAINFSDALMKLKHFMEPPTRPAPPAPYKRPSRKELFPPVTPPEKAEPMKRQIIEMEFPTRPTKPPVPAKEDRPTMRLHEKEGEKAVEELLWGF